MTQPEIVNQLNIDMKTVKPMVLNHELILRGKPEDRRDEGMIGVMNNIEDFISTGKRWIFAIGSSVLVAAILGAISFGLSAYRNYLLLTVALP